MIDKENNHSERYFGGIIEEKDFDISSSVTPTTSAVTTSAVAATGFWTTFFIKLGWGAVAGVGSWLASRVLSEVFPEESIVELSEQALEDIRELVHLEITQAFVDEYTSDVIALEDQLKVLISKLESDDETIREPAIRGMIDLMKDGFKLVRRLQKPERLGGFINAANLQLMILRTLGETVGNYLKDHNDHRGRYAGEGFSLIATVEAKLNSRVSQIRMKVKPGMPPRILWFFTNNWGKDLIKSQSRSYIEEKRREYYEKYVEQEKKAKLDPLKKVVNIWNLTPGPKRGFRIRNPQGNWESSDKIKVKTWDGANWILEISGTYFVGIKDGTLFWYLEKNVPIKKDDGTDWILEVVESSIGFMFNMIANGTRDWITQSYLEYLSWDGTKMHAEIQF